MVSGRLGEHHAMMLLFDLVSQLKMVDQGLYFKPGGVEADLCLMAGLMLIKTAIHSHPNLFNNQESSFQTPGQQRLERELRSPRCEEQLPEKF